MLCVCVCVTIIIAAAAAVVVLTRSGPWAWVNLSPAVPILYAFLYIHANAFLIATTFMNPGELPRNLRGGDGDVSGGASAIGRYYYYGATSSPMAALPPATGVNTTATTASSSSLGPASHAPAVQDHAMRSFAQPSQRLEVVDVRIRGVLVRLKYCGNLTLYLLLLLRFNLLS